MVVSGVAIEASTDVRMGTDSAVSEDKSLQVALALEGNTTTLPGEW